MLYWHVGREILQRQAAQGWGTKDIGRLSRDLMREFPDMRGFAPRNLQFMRAFAHAYQEEPIVKQLVSQIPWGHNIVLLGRVKNEVEFLGLTGDADERVTESGIVELRAGAFKPEHAGKIAA